DGEEILVLAGTFSDHTGDHGPGSYLLNPEGFEHAPSSNEGCDIFVKLRQYPGDRPTVRIDTQRSAWEPYRFDGVTRCPLYESPDLRMHLLRFAPGTALPEVLLPQRETIFVVDGTFHDEHGDYRAGSYLAFEPGEGHQPTSPQGCLLYISLSAN
ncbi:MAG: cupin domain-containing protein, partial [Myxococcales bacterium]|nr:cupin domain-containing protein [Myxococcales bacterium]